MSPADTGSDATPCEPEDRHCTTRPLDLTWRSDGRPGTVDLSPHGRDADEVDVLQGRWAKDMRGAGRAVRVSAHAEAGFLIVSTWKGGVCVSTVRLLPDEASELAAGLAAGLADLANEVNRRVAVEEPGSPEDLDARLRVVEQRLNKLGTPPAT